MARNQKMLDEICRHQMFPDSDFAETLLERIIPFLAETCGWGASATPSTTLRSAMWLNLFPCECRVPEAEWVIAA